MDHAERITWLPSYSVGNETLDRQHQQLLKLCNEAIDCMESDSLESRGAFHLILNDLVHYTETHFKTEEAILRQHDYPLLEAHRAEHLAYQVQLTDFLLEATLGKIDKPALYHYLSAWWRNHILSSDMQYSSQISHPVKSTNNSDLLI